MSPKVYSSIAAADPIAPSGLALFWPAISGADPCTGSYNPLDSPSEAEGSIPMDPASTAASAPIASRNCPPADDPAQHPDNLSLLQSPRAAIVAKLQSRSVYRRW